MPKAFVEVANRLTPVRRLSFARSLLGIGRSAALEGIPVGFAHFEEAGDSEVVAVAACEGEAFGAKKKFTVRSVVEEAGDAQRDQGIVRRVSQSGIGNINDLLAFGRDGAFEFAPAQGFFAPFGLIAGDQA